MLMASRRKLIRGAKALSFLGILVLKKATSPSHRFQLFLAPKTRLEEGHQLLCQAKLLILFEIAGMVAKQVRKHLA